MQRPALPAFIILAWLAADAMAQRWANPEERMQRFAVPSASMEPTVRMGSAIHARTGVSQADPPRRADLVLLRRNDEAWLTRIIGLPGDVVSVAGGVVTVNGVALPRRPIAVPPGFTRRAGRPVCYEETLDGRGYSICETPGRTTPLGDVEPRQVPPGGLYVMGDNRGNALDSRHRPFGFPAIATIQGRDITGDGTNTYTPLR